MVAHNGYSIPARTALDRCSTHTIITESIAQDLNCNRDAVNVLIHGAASNSMLKRFGTVIISPIFPSDQVVELDVMIAQKLHMATPPDHAKDIIKTEEFCKEKLADSRLGGKIYAIIGYKNMTVQKRICNIITHAYTHIYHTFPFIFVSSEHVDFDNQ